MNEAGSKKKNRLIKKKMQHYIVERHVQTQQQVKPRKNSKEYSIIITLNDVSIFFTFPFVWLFVILSSPHLWLNYFLYHLCVCTFTVMLFFRERISSFSFDKEEENRIDGMNVLVRCVAGWSHLLCWPPGIVTGYSAPNSNGGKSGKDTVSLRWAVMQSSSSRGGDIVESLFLKLRYGIGDASSHPATRQQPKTNLNLNIIRDGAVY